MMIWKSFGASIIGPAHLQKNQVNQDAWLSFHRSWGEGLVVSDGMGSKPLSNLGSALACRAVLYASAAYTRKHQPIKYSALSNLIQKYWLSLIRPLPAKDCAATCLLALRLHDERFHIGRLGDGLIAVLTDDDQVISLSDDKSDSFANITTALSDRTGLDWQWLSIPEQRCRAILLCTDGIADDLEDTDGFVKSLIESHADLPPAYASQSIYECLEKWPVKSHSDDKTIACLVRYHYDDK